VEPFRRKGGGAAKQRVILGSFCWVPVSLRDGGHPVDKKGIWTTLYLEVESVVPKQAKLFKKWADAMLQGATVDQPSYGSTKKSYKGGPRARKRPGRFPRKRRKKKKKED